MSFTLILVIDEPIAFAVGLSSVVAIVATGWPIALVFQKRAGSMQMPSFLAIPFSVFAGELMLDRGIA